MNKKEIDIDDEIEKRWEDFNEWLHTCPFKWSNGKEESITEIPDDVASVIDDYLTEIEGEQA